MWTSLSDMLATRTDDQLLRWKEVAENPRIDNYRPITTLRQLVVDLYNKSIKDIINELSIAVNDEINSRNGDMNMDKKLEARITRLERLTNNKYVKNEDMDDSIDEIQIISSVLIRILNLLRSVRGSENSDIRDLADSIWAQYGSKLKSYL